MSHKLIRTYKDRHCTKFRKRLSNCSKDKSWSYFRSSTGQAI